MKTALIISGGDFSPLNFSIKYDYVIACDKGYEYADRLGIIPDVILGDFDSYKRPDVDIPIISFPIEKDDTDTMLAIKHAINNGYHHIIIICALGGRSDHLIANIQSLSYIAQNSCIGEIYSADEYIKVFRGPSEFTINPFIESNEKLSADTSVMSTGYFSLFSLSDECTGLSISNAKYEVKGITLTNTFPLGHGNSFKGNKGANIKFEAGTLLLVQTCICK